MPEQVAYGLDAPFLQLHLLLQLRLRFRRAWFQGTPTPPDRIEPLSLSVSSESDSSPPDTVNGAARLLACCAAAIDSCAITWATRSAATSTLGERVAGRHFSGGEEEEEEEYVMKVTTVVLLRACYSVEEGRKQKADFYPIIITQ
ncbi:predicted protein [Coccidioides posadasii str. Silveira]|uniref:Predicted protein n=1 Tax=Coccidioides posadasii (strain RMSCC 757 / Silveira) TaxID=443226 RepID=E9D270_COCPS|nr:predicted protein [Coccidioides posadasii str. Silveira]